MMGSEQDTASRVHEHTSSRCPCRPMQRRTHQKSRNGCRNCKRRRVKCDEGKPSCSNCIRFSLPCDFSVDQIASNDTVPEDASAPPVVTPTLARRRGRPLKIEKWILNPEASGHKTITEPRLHFPMPKRIADPSPPLNTNDLELLHHYITNTSLTLGDNVVLWRDKVPRLAFEFPYVLRLLLAMSALHQTQLHAPGSSGYQQLATAHHNIALREVTGLLSTISGKDCSALYIATVLICNYHFAKPPAIDDEPGMVGEAGIGWWYVFRGVRFVVESMGMEAIFSGHIGPFPPEAPQGGPADPLETTSGDGYIPWERPLVSLAVMLSGSSTLGSESLVVASEALMECYREVYGTADKPEYRTHGKTYVVMRWPWVLGDDFVGQVQNLVPEALILLAYFAVLIQTLERFWYMKGWAKHTIMGIEKKLDPAYLQWIQWPRNQIGLERTIEKSTTT
ncbi:uncharacterized protein FOBCDRAFT_232051 [Fusarium oxysporum Fo47]|nr:uncharacterized protein FOBCDRAFT_232051 [Fusarium oxysporum Fo47]EWZ36331.1 hypothetical protein FOZG_12060 [Fusarium oxysporum Fo47]QKD60155.2 hypothetical protein FOBCDRAFT_232051 [Fusarium oxysporum Fo47]